MGGREELQSLLPTEDQVEADFLGKRYLYLNPTSGGQFVIPVLSMKCDFGRSIPKLRLQVGLFLRQKNLLRAFGYRFEAPEGLGPHHYYHAQLIHGFLGGAPFPHPEYYDWLPTDQPTFPLDADDPVKLILAVLISLYGLGYVAKLKTDAGLGNALEKYLHEMSSCSFNHIAWYWMVEVGDPVKHREFYRTVKSPREFHADFRSKYTKCRIRGFTQGAYSALGKKERRVH